MRRLISEQERTRNVIEIQNNTIPQVIECLEKWLRRQEIANTQQLNELDMKVEEKQREKV